MLLNRAELEAMEIVRRNLNSSRQDESVEKVIELFVRTKNNKEFIDGIRKRRSL